MKELLQQPMIKVLIIATTIAMVSLALRETSAFVAPVLLSIYEVLLPVAIGFVIAYVLTPLVDLFGRTVGLGRAVATGAIFLAAIGVCVLFCILAVPPMLRQGGMLVEQAVSGEPYTDRNANGVYDLGEPFTDRNHNGRRDGPLISSVIAWVESKQQHVQRLVGAHPSPEGLAMALAYVERRDALIAGDLTARSATAATAAAHAALLPVVRELRGLPNHGVISDELTRMRAAVEQPFDVESEARAKAAYAALEREERALGSTMAGEILDLLPRADSATGRQLETTMGKVESGLRAWLDGLPGRMASWASDAAGTLHQVSSLALNTLLVPIYAFFLILAMPLIRSRVKSLVPHRHREQILGIVHQIEKAVAAFFRGRLIICFICSCVGVLGFLLTDVITGRGTPYGILFGVGIGLATVIPLAGLVLLVPALILTWLQPGATSIDIILVVAVYGVIQGVEAVLIPLVMGREVELHPVTLIIALLLCGKLLGVLGLILAVPIAATVRILASVYVWPRVASWAAKGMDAVQPPAPDQRP